MSERPILFSAPMVRAILDGRKSQTRRIVSPTNSSVLGYNGETKVGRKLWDQLHFEHGDGPTKDEGTHLFGCGPNCEYLHVPAWHADESDDVVSYRVRPRVQPGDRLWVKETFAPLHGAAEGSYMYRATYHHADLKWKPSIFMPRVGSRITLEITRVRVERLNDISEADAIAEGASAPTGKHGSYPAPWATSVPGPVNYRESYRKLWESINGARSWTLNPWVWILEFRRAVP